jgi:hypothetical protein
MAKLSMGADILIAEATLLPKNEPVSTGSYITFGREKNTQTWGV